MFTLGIIGRPNVGKSTLFNRIAGKRVSITNDMPGVTRDRIEIPASWIGKPFKLVDTAGFDLKDDILKKEMQAQFFKTLDLADHLILVTDAAEGVHPLDKVVADMLRKAGKKFTIAVNKVDSQEKENYMGEFYKLGSDNDLVGISALHGRNVDDLLDMVTEGIPEKEDREDEDGRIKIAVIGRPNVGKSSLINVWLGEERVIVTPIAGTTRDSVDTLFEYKGKSYLLTDTAGIRKKSVMFKDPIEKFGYFRSIDAMARADIAIAVIDGSEGLNERDIKVIAEAWEADKPLAIAVNKWDLAGKDAASVKKFKNTLSEKLQFLANPPIIFLSALTGKNCFNVFPAVNKLYGEYIKRVPTHAVNNVLEEALEKHQPPAIGSKRLKFYYMTQVATRPPYFVAFVNYPEAVHFSYERFIINTIRKNFGFEGVPVRLSIRKRKSQYND